MYEKLAIILGSKNDMGVFNSSKATDILNDMKIPYTISICSAHRRERDLSKILTAKLSYGVRVFIGIAGMAAALPGAILSKVLYMELNPPPFVIGVGLPSIKYPDGFDALMAITRNPSGVPVAFAGVGKAGIDNAVYLAAQIIAQTDKDISRNFTAFLTINRPETEANFVVVNWEK